MIGFARVMLWLCAATGAINVVDAVARPRPDQVLLAIACGALAVSVGLLGVIAALERARIERAALAVGHADELARLRVALGGAPDAPEAAAADSEPAPAPPRAPFWDPQR